MNFACLFSLWNSNCILEVYRESILSALILTHAISLERVLWPNFVCRLFEFMDPNGFIHLTKCIHVDDNNSLVCHYVTLSNLSTNKNEAVIGWCHTTCIVHINLLKKKFLKEIYYVLVVTVMFDIHQLSVFLTLQNYCERCKIYKNTQYLHFYG